MPHAVGVLARFLDDVIVDVTPFAQFLEALKTRVSCASDQFLFLLVPLVVRGADAETAYEAPAVSGPAAAR
jgi:hypothetical protein